MRVGARENLNMFQISSRTPTEISSPCLCVHEQLMAARVGVEVRAEACWIHAVYVSGPGGARKRANARGTLVNGRAWPCWFLAALSCIRQHGSSLLHSHTLSYAHRHSHMHARQRSLAQGRSRTPEHGHASTRVYAWVGPLECLILIGC